MPPNVFYDLDGYILDTPEDNAYELVIAASTGDADIALLASALGRWVRPA